MSAPLETKEEQLAVIEANAEQFGAIAYQGYRKLQEKGTLILLRQLENNSTTLETWQMQYRPMHQTENMVSDWKETGLQELIIRYNPEVSVVCTFLYPNGVHTSYHFAPDPPPPVLFRDRFGQD